MIYFIRLTDNKNAFVKPADMENPFGREYAVQDDVLGACGFTKEQAQNFIKASGAKNLEMVPATDVVKDSAFLLNDKPNQKPS